MSTTFGARPSPGAASLDRTSAQVYSNAGVLANVPVPEDGHSPLAGARPSPGAASLARSKAQGYSGTGAFASVAAPGEGRAPLQRWLVPAMLLLTAWQLAAQTAPASNIRSQTDSPSLGPAGTNESLAVRAEKLRTVCLQGRRCVAGRVLKVFPDGVLVESGYPSLLRDSLHGAWHMPSTVLATRATNLVESLEPDSMCVGVVFLTDLPRNRGKKEKIAPYDYVVLHSYPAGQFTYSSVGGIQHTVRRFAGGLETAVNLRLQAEQTNTAVVPKPSR